MPKPDWIPKQIEITCPSCGKLNQVWVREMDYENWNSGLLIQDAFQYLTPDEREIILTGYCPKCWDVDFSPQS